MANNFALIQGDTVVEVFATDPMLHSGIDVRDVSAVPGIDIGWWIDENGHYQPPVGLTWDQAQTAAANELNQTTNISVRCTERQQPVPNDWLIYRDTLRAIRDNPDGDPNAPFPPRPPYPPGIDPPPGFPPGEVIWPPPNTPPVTFILPSGAPSSASNLPIPQSAASVPHSPGARAAPAAQATETTPSPRRGRRPLFFGMG